MDRVLQDSAQGDNVMAGLTGAFAAIAVLMAAVGIYGLVGYLVSRRTHELVVGVALGARGEVLVLVFRNSMSLVLAGVAVGLPISLALPRVVTALFQGFHAHSGLVLAGTPMTVLVVALMACYFPARARLEGGSHGRVAVRMNNNELEVTSRHARGPSSEEMTMIFRTT
jgi:putative ABC transport system permease protein